MIKTIYDDCFGDGIQSSPCLERHSSLAIRLIPAVTALSLLSMFPAIADTISGSDEVQLAFADLAGPRGITLSNGAEDPEPVSKEAANVTFAEPFVDVDPALNGQSIQDLVAGSPLFAPIEGIPDSLWKGKECSSCHAWTQETLCDQGGFYNKQGLGAVDRKEHPYGGAFKREVMRWADRGCE